MTVGPAAASRRESSEGRTTVIAIATTDLVTRVPREPG